MIPAALTLSVLLLGAAPELDGGFQLLPAPQPFQPEVSDPLLAPAARAPRASGSSIPAEAPTVITAAYRSGARRADRSAKRPPSE